MSVDVVTVLSSVRQDPRPGQSSRAPLAASGGGCDDSSRSRLLEPQLVKNEVTYAYVETVEEGYTEQEWIEHALSADDQVDEESLPGMFMELWELQSTKGYPFQDVHGLLCLCHSVRTLKFR